MEDARRRVEPGLIVEGPGEERFQLVELLGRGAFGEVYRAEGEVTGRVVAVKTLPVEDTPDPLRHQALLNEMELASQVVHSNVVQVLHVAPNGVPGVPSQ